MAMTRAQSNRAIRQEALREQLTAGGHLQHVVDLAKQLAELDGKLDSTEVARLKAAAEIKLKLIGKFLPDVKSVEVTGDADNPVTIGAYQINWK